MTETPLRILVVDDDAVDRQAVRRLLRPPADFLLEEADEADIGLTAMQTGAFDVVLLDHGMPARDGGVILTEALAAGVTSPIVVLTAHGDEQLAVDVLRNGAADYIPKARLADVDLPRRLRQVADLTRAQNESRQSQRSLQERVEFEQQLIGVVSHDLRNPLSTIRLSAQVLRAKSKDDAQKAVIERIIRATTQADRMIRDLLDFTQARLGRGIPIDPAPMDFHASVKQVITDMRVAHADRQLELEQLGSGEGTWDAGRLGQLTMNLVGNAYQHSPPDKTIAVMSQVEAGVAVLRITNQGQPIAPADLPHLFEPLRRGRSLNSSNAGSSIGLGLFISQAIARAHGGRIDVVSDANGTTFTAHLPSRQSA